MQIGLPFVSGEVALEDAAATLRQSNLAGLVVLKDDSARLFHAAELYSALSSRGSMPIGDVGGGTRLGREGASFGHAAAGETEAILLRVEGVEALVKFLSPTLYVTVSSRMYYCNLNSRHYYDAKQVQSLKKIPGGWECGQSDKGLVS